MEKFIIIEESLPVRCEICHKSDQFDNEKNICLRCQGIKIFKQNNNQVNNTNNSWIIIGGISNALFIIMFVSFYNLYSSNFMTIVDMIPILIFGFIMGIIIGSFCKMINNNVKNYLLKNFYWISGGLLIGILLFSCGYTLKGALLGSIVGFLTGNLGYYANN